MFVLNEDGSPRGLTLATERRTRFDEGALPSWVTTDPTTAGTSGEGTSYVVQPGLSGGLLMSVPATSGRRATVYGPELDLSQYAVVRVRAHALLDRDAGSEFYGVYAVGFGDDALTSGASAGCFISNNATLAQMSVTAAGTTRYVNTNMPDVKRGKFQDISLWIDCRTKDVHVGVGSQVQSFWPKAGEWLNLGVVRPRVRVATHGPAKSARLDHFEVQAWR